MTEIARIFQALAERGPVERSVFRSEVGRIRAENLNRIPAELDVEALISIFGSLGWLREDGGRVALKISAATPQMLREAERTAFAS